MKRIKAYLQFGSHGGPMSTVETTADVGEHQTIVKTPQGVRIMQTMHDGVTVVQYYGELVGVTLTDEDA